MASRSVNKVILLGRLGRDAETTYTPAGIAKSRFSVATSRRWKDQQTGDWKEETDWSSVILWRGENVANYLTKGKQVYVEGRLRNYSYDDKDGKKVYATEVVADEVILVGGRDDAGPPGPRDESSYGQSGPQPVSTPRSSSRQQQRPPAAEEPSFDQGITDDDVPF